MWQRGIARIDLDIKQRKTITLKHCPVPRFIQNMDNSQGFTVSYKVLGITFSRYRSSAGLGNRQARTDPE